MHLRYFSTLFVCFISTLYGEALDTFYGPIEVEEPVLLELIHSPPMQRLKQIHQYGVSYYTTHNEEYNRFDHSIGVFAILRKNNAPLVEQIAGLLHDVSHTVFSHVGDWVFGKENCEIDYQTTIHKLYLCHSGIEKILLKHGYTIEQVFPNRNEFQMLEQPLPNMCADRIDYNIQGAYFQNFLTKQEALELFEDFKFINGIWVATRVDLLKILAQFSFHMTQTCWGSAANYVRSRWLADAIIEGLSCGICSWYEIHFGVDQDIWEKLQSSNNPNIKEYLKKLHSVHDYFKIVDPCEACHFIKFKNRGIDPWVLFEGQCVRLCSIDEEVARAYEELREKSAIGWPIIMD